MNIKIGDKVNVVDKFMMQSFDAYLHEILCTHGWAVVSWVENNRSRFGLCQVTVNTNNNFKNGKVIPASLGLHFRCMEYGTSVEEIIQHRNNWFLSKTEQIKRFGGTNG